MILPIEQAGVGERLAMKNRPILRGHLHLVHMLGAPGLMGWHLEERLLSLDRIEVPSCGFSPSGLVGDIKGCELSDERPLVWVELSGAGATANSSGSHWRASGVSARRMLHCFCI